jgi:hypothetical protein
MDERDRVDRASKRWTWGWVTLALALGLHVADEAAHDFLSFWNPLVRSLRQEVPALPLPTFRFALWLGGLIAAVLLLLALTWFVRRGATWMRPVSYVLAALMLGNGLLHIAGTVYLGRAVPGVYSSPILIIAAGLLFAGAWGHRGAGRAEPGTA